jgi:RNA polymerase sigma-70 factor (ECF subfamily)
VQPQELVALVAGRVAAPRELLAEAIERGLAAAQARWPEATPDQAFADFLTSKLAGQKDLAAALPRLRVDDLLLAWWAGGGEGRAVQAFEAAHAEVLTRLCQRFHRLPADELRQRLRVRLFVAQGATAPRIHDYSGFGFLENWLRVTAVRVFIDEARTQERRSLEDELDEVDLLGLGVSSPDPALEPFRAQLGGAVKKAFAGAVAQLTPRERNFLRHAHVDQLTLDQIAALYHVHRATVARTLASARASLIERTRAGVASELKLPADELQSAIRLLDSRLDLSLSRVLASGTAP